MYFEEFKIGTEVHLAPAVIEKEALLDFAKKYRFA